MMLTEYAVTINGRPRRLLLPPEANPADAANLIERAEAAAESRGESMKPLAMPSNPDVDSTCSYSYRQGRKDAIEWRLQMQNITDPALAAGIRREWEEFIEQQPPFPTCSVSENLPIETIKTSAMNK